MAGLLSISLLLAGLARAGDPPQASWPHTPETDQHDPEATDEEVDANSDPRVAFLAWERREMDLLHKAWPEGHPEPNYRFSAELYDSVAPLVAERPGVVQPFVVGRTVQGRPIWGFRVHQPTDEIHTKILIFAGIHALEWISTEVATDTLKDLIEHPRRGVEVVVIPVLNLDGRRRSERDFKLPEPRPYRRANAHGVDLNRDFAYNRESDAVWKHVCPGFYYHSPAPLSQPESQALDRLASEGFDVSVSLHAFGGYVYWPWSGRWAPPPDRQNLAKIGQIMVEGMPDSNYQNKELSRWGFFFRALGTELDHIYAKYGTYSYLIELTHSGIEPLHPETWHNHFRWYNPENPTKARAQGFGAMRALVSTASYEGLPPRPEPPGQPK